MVKSTPHSPKTLQYAMSQAVLYCHPVMTLPRLLLNNGFKDVGKFFLVVVLLQLLVLLYLATTGSNTALSEKEDNVAFNAEDIIEEASRGKTLVGQNGRLLLDLVLGTKNLPYKEVYSNAELAFAKKNVPGALLDWKPQPFSYKYFQPIEGEDAWLYSAFFDHQKASLGRPMVRAFGLARRTLDRRIYCTFHDPESKNIVTKPGWLIFSPESHQTLVVTSSFECPIPKNFRPRFLSVSFVAKNVMTNRLKVHYPGRRSRNFTVCYSVLHSQFSDTSELIQSVEFNTLLGAEHFFIYNFSISAETDMVLRYYQSQGKMTVMQWPLPTIESWYLGQVIAINDCLYRNRNVSRYVVLVDTDEIIIPRRHLTWMGLVNELLINPNMSVVTPDKEYEGTTDNLLNVTAQERSHHLRSVIQRETKLCKKNADEMTRVKETAHQNITSKKADESIQKRHGKTLAAQNSSALHISPQKFTNHSLPVSNSSGIFHSDTGIPHQNVAIVKEMEERGNPEIGSFVFRCAFFDVVEKHLVDDVMRNLSISQEDRHIIEMFQVQPLSALMRTNYIFPHKIRTKMIVRPELIYTSGIHFIHYHMLKATTLWAKTEAALVHHYREYDRPRSQTPDFSALKFKDDLLARLKPVYAAFPQLFLGKPDF